MAVKKGDFIEIEYAGKVKDTDQVFDTNKTEAAKKAGIYDPKVNYVPKVICVGKGDVLEGLDEAFVGKEAGKEFTVDIEPEKGFGKKNPKLVHLMSMAKFQKENIRPVPGLRVDFGDAVGTVKTTSGGRVMVDFNHPLAGRNLTYDIKINKVITDDREKLQGFLEFYLGTKEFEVEVKEGRANIKTKLKLPDEVRKEVKEKAMERIPGIKELSFNSETKEAEKKEEEKKEASETKEEEKQNS